MIYDKRYFGETPHLFYEMDETIDFTESKKVLFWIAQAQKDGYVKMNCAAVYVT